MHCPPIETQRKMDSRSSSGVSSSMNVVRRTDGLALFAIGAALEIVLHFFHRAGFVQHQRLAAGGTEHQRFGSSMC